MAALNVLGGVLQTCCTSPLTGFYRNGRCDTDAEDAGVHSVCIKVTDDFLAFSLAHGNDLVTPRPQWNFPGLQAGDCWCLCAARWKEALDAGVAPKVRLAATHEATLQYVTIDELIQYAIDKQ
ncbi:MAG TPA: DUF2237 domain-containing protein [Bryobacteraceae bacterium]|jgi:hypothetical protein